MTPRAMLLAAIALAGGRAVADPATPIAGSAAGTASAPAASVHASAAAPALAPRGLAIGVELGEPTSATAGWFADKLAVVGALGTGTREGLGIQAHVDAQLEVHRIRPNIPIRVGLGARVYHHGYRPASIDEIPDTHVGLRGSASIALEKGHLQLYAEVAPGVDVLRTTSCNLSSGAGSLCPHALESPVFLQLAVGARWFLSN